MAVRLIDRALRQFGDSRFIGLRRIKHAVCHARRTKARPMRVRPVAKRRKQKKIQMPTRLRYLRFAVVKDVVKNHLFMHVIDQLACRDDVLRFNQTPS